MELKDQDYIGDGVYVGHDGYAVWLWVSNGIHVSDKIALDHDTFDALVRYRERTIFDAKEGKS